MTPITPNSKGCEVISRKAFLRGHHDGSRAPRDALVFADFIALTHCCCSGVIVAEPSVSCLIRVKLSTIAPTKRLSATNEPTIIHAMKKSELAE